MQRRGEALGGGGLPGVDVDLRQRRMDKPSVKEAIYNGYSNSTRADQAYSEIIDTSSLGCRRSDLTDAKSMELYCSFFDQTTPLSRLDRSYITGKQLPADTSSSFGKIREKSGLDIKDDSGKFSHLLHAGANKGRSRNRLLCSPTRQESQSPKASNR